VLLGSAIPLVESPPSGDITIGIVGIQTTGVLHGF
jgi:hypothetical protein